MELRVLGPVELRVDDLVLGPGTRPQQLLVLAALAVDAGRLVPVETLVDRVWGERPPATARRTLHTNIARVRRMLEHAGQPSAVVRRTGGYLLDVKKDQIDLYRFRRLVTRSRDAAALRDALALWRGEPLAGLPGEWAARMREAWRQQWLDAVAGWAGAELAAGNHSAVLGSLSEIVEQYPLVEPLAAMLIRALRAAGRDAEALDRYQTIRHLLADQLGVDPGDELRGLYAEMLRADRRRAADPGRIPAQPSVESQRRRLAVLAEPPSAGDHRHLPPDIAEFTGRATELSALESIGARVGGATAMIAVVDGMGGVGKTRLVIRAAHRLAANGFADGQLYADLSGFDPDRSPADPAAVLASFLRLLGVPGTRIPHDLDGRGAVFRDQVAGRRFLVVLDNAADAAQVRPLLPAGVSCLTLVTTRRNLDLDGAVTVTLHPFAEDEALRLLGAVVGADRVVAERSAAADLVARCGGLPLAIALAARRLRARPAWSIRHAADRLAGHECGVDGVFDDSYRCLEPERQRVFRLLGVHPGDDCTALSVAALAGIPPTAADRILESLLDEHLLHQDTPGRYRLHDLVRSFAARRCPDGERRTALSRLLDWYVEVAGRAAGHILRYPLRVDAGVPPSASPGPDLPDAAAATAWFDAEQGNLLAAVNVARAGWPAHTVQLAHLLRPYLVRLHRITDWIATHEAGVAAALRMGYGAGRAYGLSELGQAYLEAGRPGRALACLGRALELHRRLDNRPGMAFVRQRLGIVMSRLGRYDEAVDHYRAALDLLLGLDEPTAAAGVHSGLGIALHLLGRDQEALDHMLEALELARATGGSGEASLRTNLGLLYARLGRHADAICHAERALVLHRRARSQQGEGHCLANLSLGYASAGRYADAIDAGHRALDIGRRLANPMIEASAWNHLGEVHRLAGDHAASLDHHRAAVAAVAATAAVPLAEEREHAERGIRAALEALATA